MQISVNKTLKNENLKQIEKMINRGSWIRTFQRITSPRCPDQTQFKHITPNSRLKPCEISVNTCFILTSPAGVGFCKFR